MSGMALGSLNYGGFLFLWENVTEYVVIEEMHLEKSFVACNIDFWLQQ